ncbi:MAG: hypothetical protein A2Y25_00220 [Candidatus Melainabacteria bacterium GWF2_37_15]|nr:MAG: hypothetical protein A2Y25_00220 [Candidatus Melainabacteria bacterium GWF2_37_15]
MLFSRKFILLLVTVVTLIIVLLIMLYPYIKKGELTEKNSVPVYFVKNYSENDYKLLSVRRKIYPGDNNLEIAISELLQGPDENEKKLGYFTEIPKDTKLIKISADEKQVIINLSKEFQAGGGSASMSLRLEQLIKTALDSVNQKPVYFELEGEQVKYIGGEGIMVPQPLSGNVNKSQDI